MVSRVVLLLVVTCLALAHFGYHAYVSDKATYWTWDDGQAHNRIKINVDVDSLVFPHGMLWGVSTAAHQIEGNATNSNWARWETQSGRILRGQVVGKACDHWNRVAEDIKLLKELGVNSYRMSLDWSKLEPSPDVWDAYAIKHYHEEIDMLLAASIAPMITLHHFTQPLWFDELGGFEKSAGIERFVIFSRRMFEEYGSKVSMWCTINEPEVYVSMGWFTGVFPPGKKDDAQTAGEVMRNMLEAHVQVYKALKSTPQGKYVKIGIVKNIFFFDPYMWWNPFDHLFARLLDTLMNEAILEFFKSGAFHFNMPGQASVSHVNSDAPLANDFLGLNYYSRYRVTSNLLGALRGEPPFLTVHRDGELMTDMPHPIYPEGLHRALQRMAEVGRVVASRKDGGKQSSQIPVIVTECGIADEFDDRRALYIKRYMYALSKAIQDGIKVDGFFYWSLYDNFEWAEGYDMKFGLYHNDFRTQNRTLRHGSAPYVALVKKHASPLL